MNKSLSDEINDALLKPDERNAVLVKLKSEHPLLLSFLAYELGIRDITMDALAKAISSSSRDAADFLHDSLSLGETIAQVREAADELRALST